MTLQDLINGKMFGSGTITGSYAPPQGQRGPAAYGGMRPLGPDANMIAAAQAMQGGMPQYGGMRPIGPEGMTDAAAAMAGAVPQYGGQSGMRPIDSSGMQGANEAMMQRLQAMQAAQGQEQGSGMRPIDASGMAEAAGSMQAAMPQQMDPRMAALQARRQMMMQQQQVGYGRPMTLAGMAGMYGASRR